NTSPWPTDFPYYGPQWSYAIWSLPNGNPKVYICPSDYTLDIPLNLGAVDPNMECSYAGNGLVFIDYNGKHTRKDTTITPHLTTYPGSIPDGTSNTIFFTEYGANCGGGGSEHNWIDDGTLFGTYAARRGGVTYGPAYSYFQVQPPISDPFSPIDQDTCDF